ncbi:MAG TPA: ABC transporter permease [Flavisolibacter sp.]|nr:ABC transporter permease [Flavisolibacter sp.]
MPQKYNQLRAMTAVIKASLIATFRSPQSVFFSLFFPIVLIWIFGSLGGNGRASFQVAFEKNTDSLNQIYQVLRMTDVLNFVDDPKKDINDELERGRIVAVIGITPSGTLDSGAYNVNLRTSSASQRDFPLLKSIVKNIVADIDSRKYPDRPTVATITESMVEGRKYRMIDFFLPGMIGFSLIGSAVFGIAFTLYSLKETLVLKRMYSTPIRRQYIILGESIAKVVFNMMTVIVLIAFGHYVYDFTLSEGWITFANMLILSFVALLVFMGFGFFVSSISKNQNVIPIYANLFMFPQYFLSGTFFPKTALPAFVQPIIKFLPLTAVNDAMRNVAFEGASLASCWEQLLILAVWGVLIYIITARVFRWD